MPIQWSQQVLQPGPTPNLPHDHQDISSPKNIIPPGTSIYQFGVRIWNIYNSTPRMKTIEVKIITLNTIIANIPIPSAFCSTNNPTAHFTSLMNPNKSSSYSLSTLSMVIPIYCNLYITTNNKTILQVFKSINIGKQANSTTQPLAPAPRDKGNSCE